MQPDTTSAPPTGAPSPALTAASVDVGPVCTRYLRAGTGAPVLVLGAGAFAAAPRDALVARLAGRVRVIVPDLDADRAPSPCDASPSTGFAAWLREFLDGLGVLQASVIAHEDFALRAMSFCLTDPLRVRRLVLFYRDGADPAVRAAAAPEPLGQTRHPLLLRRRAETAGEIDDVVRFLLGGGEADDWG